MPDNTPQIVSITSEALQARVRNLLPSQQGFGHDLQASNVILPIIDITDTAAGSSLPIDLQNALAFGSQTAFSANNSTDVIVNATGFYRIIGNSVIKNTGGIDVFNSLTMTDGLSVKTVWKSTADASSQGYGVSNNIDFIVFLASGESISAVSSSTVAHFNGSSRQIADVNGNLVNPSGFVSQ